MTQDYAKPSTTKKAGEPKKKGSSGKAKGTKSATSKKASGASLKELPSSPPSKSRAPLFLSLITLICAFAYGIYFLQSIPPTAAPEKKKTLSLRKKQKNKLKKRLNKQTAPVSTFTTFYPSQR